MWSKEELRKYNHARRLALSDEKCKQFSHEICMRAIGMNQYQEADCILLYSSIRHEADLSELFKDAHDKNKKIYYPLTKKDIITFHKVTDLKDLSPGNFGVLEPDDFLPILDLKAHKVICFVPGLAFSKDGHRIGYGKGNYDRFFHNVDAKVIYKVGIGYAFQMEHDFEADIHDVKLDCLISEEEQICLI